MDTCAIEPSGHGEFAAQVKLAADGLDPERHYFKTGEDAERWIAKQKAWKAARSMRPGLSRAVAMTLEGQNVPLHPS